jgi:hypothetical protein
MLSEVTDNKIPDANVIVGNKIPTLAGDADFLIPFSLPS